MAYELAIQRSENMVLHYMNAYTDTGHETFYHPKHDLNVQMRPIAFRGLRNTPSFLASKKKRMKCTDPLEKILVLF